jgi:hypothetical protein
MTYVGKVDELVLARILVRYIKPVRAHISGTEINEKRLAWWTVEWKQTPSLSVTTGLWES